MRDPSHSGLGVHRVPASLAEPWGMDSMEGFNSALLWGKLKHWEWGIGRDVAMSSW